MKPVHPGTFCLACAWSTSTITSFARVFLVNTQAWFNPCSFSLSNAHCWKKFALTCLTKVGTGVLLVNESSFNFVSTDFNTRLLTLLMFCAGKPRFFGSSAKHPLVKSHSHHVHTVVPINAILQVVCIVCSTLHKCTTRNVRRKSCLIISIFLFKLIQT